MVHLFFGVMIAAALAIVAPVAAETRMSPVGSVASATPSERAAAGTQAAPVVIDKDTTAPAPGGKARRKRATATAAIKPGIWEFTSELQTPAAPLSEPPPQSSQTAPPQTADAVKTVNTVCIVADNAVPAEVGPDCNLDNVKRAGSRITWSMTCTKTQLRAEGVAQYYGDTMNGTVVSRMPSARGASIDITQRIRGRYLQPCARTAENSSSSPPVVPAAESNATIAGEGASPAATGNAPPPKAENAGPQQSEKTASAPRSKRAAHRYTRQVGKPHRRYHNYYARRGSWGRWAGTTERYSGAYGPNPYSSNGP